ncbi:MAG: ORF6N domain-containing protein [Elusimicrobia bacterium]|nr:ORF6N domain-containing protein [Elusimicrobiota bacterium]
MKELIPTEIIKRKIFLIRGEKVMIDRDLAELYEAPTKALNQAVKRNLDRFPEGFMFRLVREEMRELVTNCDRFASLKHASVTPMAFTVYGVAMLSSVLKSKRAARINVEIIRTFIKLQQALATRKDLAKKLEALENRITKNEADIETVAQVIRDTLLPKEEKPHPRIGFYPPEKDRS